MVGAFYQPKAVIIDILSLQTLPEREISAGLAEVIKYGLIREPKFFEWLEANVESIKALDTPALAYAIKESCACKDEVVEIDEKEDGGIIKDFEMRIPRQEVKFIRIFAKNKAFFPDWHKGAGKPAWIFIDEGWVK